MTAADRDHLIAGASILDGLGYPHDAYWAASAGKSADESDQVLVIGRNHLEIVGVSGESKLDAGLREVRGLRPLPGVGIEVFVTHRVSDAGEARPVRWVHSVSDQAAYYLDDLWLNMRPSMHDGIQLNSRPWREEEYAYYVGRVLTEAADCEVKLTAVLMTVELLGKKLKKRPRGLSGKPLAALLKEVGEVSPAFRDVAERYEAWYVWRNFSAHGIRNKSDSGHPSAQVFKMKTKDDGTGEDFEILDQDFRDLAKLWHAFYMLGHDASRIAIALHFNGGSIDERLRDLPLSNSVSAAERLPEERS